MREMATQADDLTDIENAIFCLRSEMGSLLRLAKRLPIDIAGQVQTAAALVEQAIDELDTAAEPLAHEVNAAECRAEDRHQRLERAM